MLLTPHTMVGIAIGATIQNPILAIPFSFLMHFGGDLVPHYDLYDDFPMEEVMNKGWRPLAIIADLVLGVGVGLFFTLYALWVNHNPSMALNIFLCGITAVAPDGLYAPILYWNSQNKVLRGFYNLQHALHNKTSAVYGILTQLFTVALAFLVISGSLKLL